jgi:hypothetical protein
MSRSEDFLKGTYIHPYGNADEYVLGKTNEAGSQTGATMSVLHPKTSYTTYNDPSLGKSDFEYNNALKFFRDDPYDKGPKNYEKTGQKPLFITHHEPPVVDIMTATKDSTNDAMKLASYASEETRRRFGERPLASDDLSKHSLPVVNSAIKRGIVKGIKGKKPGELAKEPTNSLDWSNSETAIAGHELANKLGGFGEYNKVDDKSVKTDFDTIKEEIRAKYNAANQRSPQFKYPGWEQPTLS